MIAHVLIKAGLNPGFYIGGFPHGWTINASFGNNRILVTEADESDLSINELHPTIGITLNLDNDHAWNVGGLDKLLDGFRKYASDSKFFLNGSDKFPQGFLNDLKNNGVNFLKREVLGLDENLTEAQKDNIITVLSVAKYFGVNPEFALEALKSFPGVERRMTLIFESANVSVIEDYAHHPAEISAVLAQARKKYPDYRIVVLFQPHREKRLQYCFEGFAHELKKADLVFVLPVYGAWEDIGKRLDLELSKSIGTHSRNISSNWPESATELVSSINSKEKTLLMLLGAGDINHIIEPLLNALSGNPTNV
jgi:UDP-N-acetylmuramate--alanine ligase